MSDDDYQHSDADAPNEDLGGRELPRDEFAEQSVLGGMMLAGAVTGRDVVDDVVDNLLPSEFFWPKHEVIARAIVALHRAGQPTDVITVTDELQRTGKLTAAGGAEYLHTLTGAVPNVSLAGMYAGVVAKHAAMRGLIDAGLTLIGKGYASEGDPEQIVDEARTVIDGIAGRKRVTAVPLSETLGDTIADLESPPTYIETPWESLNRILGGLAPGALYVPAARPGAGKSITLLQAAIHFAHKGAVAMSSLEMTKGELNQRLLAQYSAVEMGNLRSRTLSALDWDLLADARKRLIDAPLFIDDTPGVTLAHVRAHARAVLRRHGSLSMIAVDYLQLMKGEGRDRQEEVSNIAEGLKNTAKEFNVPVLAAAQLRRGTPGRGGKTVPPTLSDLRESGGIENNADVVILMDRPDVNKDLIDFIVAKNRQGAQGKATLRWQGQFARLRDKEFDPTAHLFPREEAQ